jgi:hypothetical protein
MLRKIAFAGAVGLAFTALAPIPSSAAPVGGAFAVNAGTDIVPVQLNPIYDRCTCIRKSSGRLVCGIFDRYGGFHESEVCYSYRGRPYRGW